jgi:hypothetical protein
VTWRARSSAGVPLGLLFIGLVLFIDVWLLNRLITVQVGPQQINFLSFVAGLVVLLSLPLLISLAYQTLSCLTLRYHLDRDGLTIRWLGGCEVIPIRTIHHVLPGSRLGGPIVRRKGTHWPGHERGEGAIPGIGWTRFLATRAIEGQLLVVRPGHAVAISPERPEEFLEALASRQELGPNRLVDPESRLSAWLTWTLWTDRTAGVLLGAAVLINMGLFAYLCARFPGLDQQLPLHFSSQGMADRIGTKAELFALPIIGLIILATNLVLGLILYRKERAGSYLLWGAAAAAQVLFWLATFGMVY